MAGGGLIVAGLAVLVFGFVLFLGLGIQSEEQARDICDAADAGEEAGNETCDATDRTFIGFQSTIIVIGIMATGVALIVLGIMQATRTR